VGVVYIHMRRRVVIALDMISVAHESYWNANSIN